MILKGSFSIDTDVKQSYVGTLGFVVARRRYPRHDQKMMQGQVPKLPGMSSVNLVV